MTPFAPFFPEPVPPEPVASFGPDALWPLVSVIMPTYNAGRFIVSAVRSVLAQTYPHWELIIVDDASSDETESVLKPWLTDPRIRYHRVARIGHPAGVRNVGLKMAQGELIAFLDSDDLYFPQTLAKLARPLLEDPMRFAVYGFAFNMNAEETPVQQSVQLLPLSEAPAPDQPAYALPPHYSHGWEQIVTAQISNMLPALMIRQSSLAQIGPFNESLCGPEDYEFYVRMFLHDYAGVYCLSDYVYRYRIHAASLTKAPEHCQRLLSSCLKIMHWMFHEGALSPLLKVYQSRAYAGVYRYLARERLLNRQPAMARRIAWQALGDRNVRWADFLGQCGPLMLRSFLPPVLDGWMVRVRATLRLKRHLRQAASFAPLREASA